MDSYRRNLAEIEPAEPGSPGNGDDADGSGARPGDDEIGQEPPPASVGQDERRMQVRAYNHWASLLEHRAFPRIEELRSGEMNEFADHAVVLDFSPGITNPAVTFLGEKLAEECGIATTITRLSDVPGRSLLSRITDHYLQILAHAAPIGFEAEFVNLRGKTVLYRGILLPFSSVADSIQHILGIINWKEVADPVVSAGLQLELESAAQAVPSGLSGAPLAAWADGPVEVEATELDGALQPDANLAETLRKLPGLALQDIGAAGSEFAVVLIRRLPEGRLCWLGEVSDDPGLIDRTARRLLH